MDLIIEDEGRKELKKHYDLIRKCKICVQNYGIDKGTIDNGICPICRKKAQSNQIKLRLLQKKKKQGKIVLRVHHHDA